VNEFERIDLAPMTQADARAIAQWRYDPPHDFYDADADRRDLAELLDPLQRGDRYFSAHDEDGVLVVFSFVEMERPT
jgi:[ribosomal protein S18]-alanine N-acetyltransferase